MGRHDSHDADEARGLIHRNGRTMNDKVLLYGFRALTRHGLTARANDLQYLQRVIGLRYVIVPDVRHKGMKDPARAGTITGLGIDAKTGRLQLFLDTPFLVYNILVWDDEKERFELATEAKVEGLAGLLFEAEYLTLELKEVVLYNGDNEVFRQEPPSPASRKKK